MISSKRLFLRPLTISDAEQFFKYRSDAQTNKHQSWIPQTLAGTDDWIKSLPSEFNLLDTWFQLAIELKDEKKLIGDLGIHFIGPENLQCELGITLAKDHHSKGFALEAMKAVISHLFTELKKHRIFASMDPANISAIRLLESLGFRKEAHFIKSYFNNGLWTDDLIYALLSEDWERVEN